MQFNNPQQLTDFIKPNGPIKIYNHDIRIYMTPTHTEQNDDNDFSIYGNNVIIVEPYFINIYPYTSITIPINENNTWNFEPLSLMELSVYRNLIKNGVLKERSFIDKQEAVRDNIEYKKFFSYLL